MNSVLIGYGYWGKIVEKYLLASKDFKLKKVYNSNNIMEFFERDIKKYDIKSVFLCTPTETHYELSKNIIENKLNLFCEKPISNSVGKTTDIINLSKKNNVILFADYIYRFSEGIKKLKEIFESLNLEDVKYIKMKINQFGNFYRESSVTDIIGVHMISVLAYIFGDTFEVSNLKKIFEYSPKNGNVAMRITKFKVKNIDISIEESILSLKKERIIEIVSETELILFDMLSETSVIHLKGKWKNEKFECLNEYKFKSDEGNNLKNSISAFFKSIESSKYEFYKQDILISDLLDKINKL